MTTLVFLLLFQLLGCCTAITTIPSDQPQGPLPQDGTVLDSITSRPSNGSKTFSLPVSAQSIFFLTRGSFQTGTLKFELAPAGADPTEVTINIALSEDPAVAFDISLLEQSDDGGHGVGFFTPNTVTPNPPLLQFNVTVQFPTTGSPLVVNRLTTSLGNWGQMLALNNEVNFNSVSLTSGTGSVDINGTNLGSTSITVGKGAVTGSFSSIQNISVSASGGEINITNTIINTDQSTASTSKLTTTDGSITASISLASNFTGSTFNVSTTTSNGAISLAFPGAPDTLPFPILNLNGATSNAAINVTLNPTYQGAIILTTTGAGNVPALNVNPAIQDPSGQNRTHVITGPTVIGELLNAAVGWGQSSPPNPGSVVLSTTNGGNECNIIAGNIIPVNTTPGNTIPGNTIPGKGKASFALKNISKLLLGFPAAIIHTLNMFLILYN